MFVSLRVIYNGAVAFRLAMPQLLFDLRVEK